MSDEAIVAHLIAARAAGVREQVVLSLRILAFANHQRVLGWVVLKVPRQDVDEVASQVLESAIAGAIRAPFEGEQVGQFRAWLHRICTFRIADYHRSRENKPDAGPIPGGPGSEEGSYGEEPSVPDATDSIFVGEVVEQALGELGDVHRRCVELGGKSIIGFEGIPAKEAAGMINDQFHLPDADSMTDVNVHKILSRFHARCRDLYAEGGQDG
jgi:DNA-directed RNA polymerase specialized sigma24 family protein